MNPKTAIAMSSLFTLTAVVVARPGGHVDECSAAQENPLILPPLPQPGGEGWGEGGRLALAAFAILKQRCYRCHGQNGVANREVFVLDRGRLVSAKAVAPGDSKSLLLAVVESGKMPMGAEKLTDSDIQTLRQWVLQGAPDWYANENPAPRKFLSESDILQLIERDLQQSSERDRRFFRYFSLAHLYNAGVPEEELDGYRLGLAKLLNSLSWHRLISRPQPIDSPPPVPSSSREGKGGGLVLRIDLRDFDLTPDLWQKVLASYPYVVRTSEADRIRQLTGVPVPYVRADWFVASASVPPLYHEILVLPATLRELENLLRVDVARNLVQEKNIVRAGIRQSGVSKNNRILERHVSAYGAYWKSFDFNSSQGEQNTSGIR